MIIGNRIWRETLFLPNTSYHLTRISQEPERCRNKAFQPVENPGIGEEVVLYFEGWITQTPKESCRRHCDALEIQSFCHWNIFYFCHCFVFRNSDFEFLTENRGFRSSAILGICDSHGTRVWQSPQLWDSKPKLVIVYLAVTFRRYL